MTTMQEASRKLNALVEEASKIVIGKTAVLRRLALGVATGGHVLLEDYPGVAKTLMVKTVAQAMGLSFRRIQFTPDLLPADITGSFYFNLQANRFELRKGPVFTNVLLADEINRAPPKTQSALLEAMQEMQTTLEGETHALPDPFVVFATQNPVEIEGTYPLPEAQLDRFIMRLRVGYPSREEEVEMLRRREAAGRDEVAPARVLEPADVAAIRAAVEKVRLDDHNKDYVVRLVHATRGDARLAIGASPRGSLALYKLAKAHALLAGRGYVVPDDVKSVAVPALAHRVSLTAEARLRGQRADAVVAEILAGVPAPVPPAPARAAAPPPGRPAGP